MVAEEKEIIWLDKNDRLSQIYSTGIEFAFISPTMQQVHQFVLCKDFLHDVIYAFLKKKTATIYGFSYDPTQMPPLDLGHCRLAVQNKKIKDFSSKIPNVIDFLNQIEKELHLKRSIAYPIKGATNALLVEGSSKWMNSPPMISLYTLLIRTGTVHDLNTNWNQTISDIINKKKQPGQTNDVTYLTTCKDTIQKIVSIGYRPFFYKDMDKNYPETSIHSLHNNAGIVSLANKASIVSYWQRKSLEKRVKKESK